MSRTHKRPRAQIAETPLPERPRLERTPDFIPVVLRFERPRHGAHYRETFMNGEPARFAFVTHEFHEHDECRFHNFSLKGGLARFGLSNCTFCGAEAWSAWWVAAGLYGLAAALHEQGVEVEVLDILGERGDAEAPEDGTGAYIVECMNRYEEALS